MGKTILAIDNGTQSIRALLFDLDGELLAKSQLAIGEYEAEHTGWSEYDPEKFWQLLGQACKTLWEEGNDPGNVACVTVTTQRGTVICLDKDGKVLRPAITWMDERQLEDIPPLPFKWRALFALVGQSGAINQLRKDTEANWIAQKQPDIWARTDKFVQLSGFLNTRLTGHCVDSVGSQVGYFPFDYKTQSWAAPKHWLWDALEIKREQLPELVKPGERIGALTDEARQHLGLPECIPVIASAADKACEIVGAGANDASIGCLSYGTRATASIQTSKYFLYPAPLPSYPAAFADMYTPEAAVPLGYWMVNWFKQEFGHPERRRADKQNIAPETLFDELLLATPPGAMGLVLRPNWGGNIGKDKASKGAILGFRELHTRGHLYRAIVEGIAFELRKGLSEIAKKNGVPITKIRVSGGGSQSEAIMQITADIFGLPTERPHIYETSGLGAAMVASVGMGLHKDFSTAMTKMAKQGRVFHPDQDAVKIYDKLYAEVYTKLPKQLSIIDQALDKIF
ncbi:MAG: carbohydrate kinase [Robiginitomaculum sp.]|nr:MAG: carbohydrate kinase [Robiginitomaculum sp.]